VKEGGETSAMRVSPLASDGDADEGADDVIEPLAESIGHGPDVAEGLSDLKARPRFARGPKGRAVPGGPHPPDRAAALTEVEDHAACGPPDLPPEIGIAPLDGLQFAAQHLKSLEHDIVDLEHRNLLPIAPKCARAPPPRRRAQDGSRLRAGFAAKHRRLRPAARP